MTPRRTLLLILFVLGVALAAGGGARAEADLGDLPGLQTNPWDFDPGDDGVSEGPLSGGGSGAGDPWPRRVVGQSLWVRDSETQVHSLTHPRGVVALAWTTWDGEDTEIALALVDAASGGGTRTFRVTDDRFDDRNPILLASPRGDLGIAWERRVGRLSLLAFAPLDLERGELGRTRVIAALGSRVVSAALALEGPSDPRVMLARRRGPRTLEIGSPGRDARARGLVAIPAAAADSLELRATLAGTLVLTWREDEVLEGWLVRDREGHWGSPLYVAREGG